MLERYYKKFYSRWMPTRVVICIMMFSACWTSYMCRLQMAILAVPMIRTEADKQNISGVCADQLNSRGRRWLDLDHQYENEQLMRHFENDDIEQSSHTILRRVSNGTFDIAEKKLSRTDENNIKHRTNGISLFSGVPFEWTAFIRGQLISAYGWGNVPGNFIGGVLAQKYGPRRAIFWSSAVAAIISLLTPIIAQISWIALGISRIVIGLTGGITFPACHTLVARWSPPDEKGRFIWTLQGGTFGSIFLFGIISSIAENINWESGWYIPSITMIVWLIFWFFLAFDSPEEHPGISDAEKNYIIASQLGSVKKEKPPLKETPILKILTSIPFLCLILCHFGNLFLLFFYQNGMMLYQTKALGFKLTKGGVVSGLPWASRVILAFLFGWAGDTIKRRNIMSVTALRKSATFFSHFLPGVCLIVVGYLGCSLVWANVFLILSLGFNGAASISNLSNNQDLSPNYAGFLYGIMNTFGSLSAIIISPMVEEVAGKWGNPIEKWQILFWIGAAVCIFCMLVFIVGGSGKVQSWNEIKIRDNEPNDGERGTAREPEKT